jgi:hypothetical protein
LTRLFLANHPHTHTVHQKEDGSMFGDSSNPKKKSEKSSLVSIIKQSIVIKRRKERENRFFAKQQKTVLGLGGAASHLSTLTIHNCVFKNTNKKI